MDLISIIVPVYNVEKYIHQCVDSIINQTYKNIEIILVDDGSPDNCGKICDEYAEKDSRIKVIHKENGGLSDARNHGIDAANGEWLMFVDSDDYILPDMAGKLLCVAKENNVRMAVCGVILFDDEKEYVPSHLTVDKGVYSAEDIFANNIPTSFVVAWNKIYDKHLFDEYRFEKGRIHEDEIAAHHLIGQCDRVAVTEEKFYRYRQVAGSITKVFNYKRLDCVYAQYDRFEYYKECGFDEFASATLKAYFWSLDKYFFRIEKTDESKERIKECLKNTRKLLFCYFKEKDISVKEKIMRTVFCVSPSLYKRISKF